MANPYDQGGSYWHEPFPAWILSGAANLYSWQEAFLGPTGSFTSGASPRTGVLNASQITSGAVPSFPFTTRLSYEGQVSGQPFYTFQPPGGLASGTGGGGGTPYEGAGFQLNMTVPTGVAVDASGVGSLDFNFGGFTLGNSGQSIITPGSSSSVYLMVAQVNWPATGSGTYRMVSLTDRTIGSTAFQTNYQAPLSGQALTTTATYNWVLGDGGHYGLQVQQDTGATLTATVKLVVNRLGP